MVLRCELFNTIALKLPDSIISQFLMHVESLFTGSKDYYKVNPVIHLFLKDTSFLVIFISGQKTKTVKIRKGVL